MVAPLLVETAQSTKLIDDVVGGDRLLGVVLQRNAGSGEPAAARDVRGRLRGARVEDAQVSRTTPCACWSRACGAFASRNIPRTDAVSVARSSSWCKDLKEDSVELTAMMRNAQSQFQEIIKLSPALSEQIKIAALNTEDPGHFADLIAVNLNLSLEERQKLLETTSVKERLTRLLPMLNREHEVLTLSSKIQSEVATSISKTQRDFFLREQMRAIQRELGESDPNASEIRTAAGEDRADARCRAEAEAGGDAGTGTAAADAARPRPNTASAAITSTGSSACRGRRRPRTRSTWPRPSAFSTSSISG